MTARSYVALGVDLGTSGVRVVAIDEGGALVAEANRTYPLLTPRPGWTEQRPHDWRDAAVDAIAEVATRLEGRTPVAIGLSGQMHGMVPLDERGDPVRPALLWNDQRTGDAVREMRDRVPRSTFIERTGNPAITGFQAPKLLWLRTNEPEAYARTKSVLLPKDYLAFCLTGERAAEPSDASGTNVFHLETQRWDDDILAALELDGALFPNVVRSSDVVGGLTREMAARTGLPAGLPVVAGAGDNAAAATGLGLSSARPELGSVSLGTSGVLFVPLADARPDPDGRVHLFCHSDGGYHLLGVTLAAAGSLQWYRDTLAPGVPFDALVQEAASSPPGAAGVTYRPYLAGERTPHMNPDLRGSLTGLSLATTRADVTRAVLEGVAFSLRDALDVMTPLARPQRLLATGGGAKSDTWLQIVADALGIPLERPKRNEGAAYGAALLALQGTRRIDSPLDLAAGSAGTTFEPHAGRYDEALERYRM